MRLRTKILIPVVSLIVLLSVSLSIIYYFLFSSNVKDQFVNRGISVATNLGMNGGLGVLMEDPTQLEPIINAAMYDEDVVFASFYAENGNQILSSGFVPGDVHNLPTGERGSVLHYDHRMPDGTQMLVYRRNVYARALEGEPIGSVAVGISTEAIRSVQRSAILWSVLLSIAFSSTAIFIVLLIMKIINPLIDGIHKVSSGDLSIELEKKRDDEIGGLIDSLNRLVANFRSVVLRLSEVSASLSQRAAEILTDTDTIATGAQEQTSQAGEVASAVEEMTKTIVENSKNASETEEVAKKSRETAERGYKVVEDTLTGMRRIADVVRQSAGTVGELGKSSDQIGEIISVIDDIADQTNLLALNAAIEAARAGEQGRGFAVVADEVRKLAERTTKATKEIALMIKKIQSDTGGAVRSMEEGTKEVDDGIALADRAGEALQEIVQTSQKVTDMVAQIAAASEQQSSASEQISKNVEAISSVTHQTAGGTEQVARAAGDLNRLTEELQQLVAQFKLRQSDARSESTGGYGQQEERKYAEDRSSRTYMRENGMIIEK